MCFDKIVEMAETLPLTKRTMLKIIASVYDWIGWISPIVIPFQVHDGLSVDLSSLFLWSCWILFCLYL